MSELTAFKGQMFFEMTSIKEAIASTANHNCHLPTTHPHTAATPQVVHTPAPPHPFPFLPPPMLAAANPPPGSNQSRAPSVQPRAASLNSLSSALKDSSRVNALVACLWLRLLISLPIKPLRSCGLCAFPPQQQPPPPSPVHSSNSHTTPAHSTHRNTLHTTHTESNTVHTEPNSS